ncbi:MAG: tRNA uridine-5-carboxymethylaminomethyl(34) synthesis GTPase MnmE, partial [Muribaculaceae bacterium]|nr:tRNA uridine-5-carboxymethylaminomethyl(34) synthesis GTPase MnmE [Muribaculaceae bacterium]
NLLIRQGCRLAEPGEFTRRAFVAGQMDLAQAEAVADLIAASSRAAHRIAARQMRGQFSSRLASLREQLLETAALLELELDFSEEDVEFASREHIRDLVDSIIHEINRLRHSFAAGNAIKEGIPVAIIGATNAGKSSLLNAIVGDDRAIVSDIHGTTRDTIEETITVADYNFRFIDTAGLRDTTDIIEQQGIKRSRRAIAEACIVLAVVDVTVASPASIAELLKTANGSTDTPSIILLLNKIDLIDSDSLAAIKEQVPDTPDLTVHCISTKTGAGLDTPVNGITLADILRQIADRRFATGTDDILVTNARHLQALTNAAESAARVADSLAANLSGDLIAQDLRQTIAHLTAITGDIPSDTVLATIFSRFCIGK